MSFNDRKLEAKTLGIIDNMMGPSVATYSKGKIVLGSSFFSAFAICKDLIN